MPTPVSSVIYSFTEKKEAFIAFLLDETEFTRFTYKKQDNSCTLTARPETTFSLTTLGSFLKEVRVFNAHILNRFSPDLNRQLDSSWYLTFYQNPTRITLQLQQGGFSTLVTYFNRNVILGSRNQVSFSWGDFLEFIKWHEILFSYTM